MSKKDQSKFRSISLFVLDVLLNVGVIVLLVVLIRFYLISPFQVHGPSMCSSFNIYEDECIRGNGEYIMIYKLGYRNLFGWQVGLPERGDVVVFRPPEPDKGEFYIKRVIGVPGDLVKFEDGYVVIYNDENPDGWRLDESIYLNEDNWGDSDGLANFKSAGYGYIAEGNYFLVGDNRNASSDSRHCFSSAGCAGGKRKGLYGVPLENIQGRAVLVMWPFGHVRTVPRVDYSTY